MGQQPADIVHNSPIVTGTIEWPTIKNTRVTLFDLMDHLKQGLPPHFVALWYHLTPEEMDEVMQFLKAHETEIERAYAAANARAAAQRRYWEARNRHVLTSDVSQFPPPSHANAHWWALRDTLLAARKKCYRAAERHGMQLLHRPQHRRLCASIAWRPGLEKAGLNSYNSRSSTFRILHCE